MSGFVTVMPYEGGYAIVLAPAQPTEPGAVALSPTTLMLSRDGLLGLVHEAQKALVVGEGEQVCGTFETVCRSRGHEDIAFPSWHWPEVLEALRAEWDLATSELPTEAVQSAIVVPSDLVVEAKGAPVDGEKARAPVACTFGSMGATATPITVTEKPKSCL